MLEWRTDEDLVVGDTRFTLAPAQPPKVDLSGEPNWFILRKPRRMVECYEQLEANNAATNILELGIDRGGSTALLALLFNPSKLVAADIRPTRVESLDDFIAAHTLQDRVRPYFGVDQSDRAHLESIVVTEFGGAALDLVIDDASHLFHQTCASFNLLFPRLRPGGLYVIEDWSWQHMRDEQLERLLSTPEAQKELASYLAAKGGAPKAAPLSVLILELVLTAGYADDVVAEITTLRRDWIAIRRGPAALDPDTFDIAAAYGSLGREVLNGETSR
jgi:predicted O-methyltransferase YrrM